MKPSEKKSNLQRLMAYAGRFRYFTYASWILSALSAFIALVPFWYIWRIIREVLEAAPDFSRAQNLTQDGLMAFLFAVLSIMIYVSGLMCSHIAAFRVAANIRCTVMRHIVKLPVGVVSSFGSGRLRKIVNESSEATETYLAHQLPDEAGAIATPCGLLILLLVFDWRLGLLSLLPAALGFLVMMSMIGSRGRQKMREYQNALDDMSNEAVEYVRGIPVVKTFGQTVFSFKKFKDAIDRYGVWVIAYTKEMRTPMVFYVTVINSVFAFLIAGGLLLTRNGADKEFLLNLMFYIIITPAISLTLTRIMFQSRNAMIVDDALCRIDSVLKLEPFPEPENPDFPKDSSITLEDVSFSYDGKKKALSHVSLEIKPGQTAAFVGPSGSGKTTLAGLIARFFDPGEGRVLIGGADARNIPKRKLMETVSFVFQDSRLIKASILENVRLGRPEADKEQVMAALKAARCMDIIEKLPDGADTVIGTKGIYLSGGEQQRIAIARVILKNTPIIILDEATAFADPDNENGIQAAFNEMAKGKTVIMIAHRLSTVVHADCIFVLKEGRIAEAGSCGELTAAGGVFSRMWKEYQTAAGWKVSAEGVNG